MRIGEKALDARRDPFDRFAGGPGRQHQRAVFGIGNRALAETAADVARFEDQFVFGDTGIRRHLLAQRRDALIADIEAVNTGGIVVCDQAGARFHRAGRDARAFHLQRRNVRSLGKCGSDGLFIAGFNFKHQIAGHAVVQLRRTRRQCIFGECHGLQIAVFDFNEFGGVLCRGSAVGDDDGDGFADEPHFFRGQHRTLMLVRIFAAAAGEGQRMRRFDITGAHGILAGENQFDAGAGQRARAVDCNDLGVCAVGAHEVRIELTGRVPVGSVFARTGDQADVFDAIDG